MKNLSISSTLKSFVEELSLEDVKLNILAQSVRCPGFSTLACNLITSHNLYEVTEAEWIRGLRLESWQREYLYGCSQQLYVLRLCPRLQGTWFKPKAFIQQAR